MTQSEAKAIVLAKYRHATCVHGAWYHIDNYGINIGYWLDDTEAEAWISAAQKILNEQNQQK
jgi:hypothetical protein